MYQQTAEGVILSVKVMPNSPVSAFGKAGTIRIHAVPEKGQANAELISFLSKTFKIAKKRVILIKGETSQHKKILLEGLTIKDIEACHPS